MNCGETNPCGPCQDPCQDPSPCYQDCGCLNPTTFECITKPGTIPDLGITDDMNGKQVLEAIKDTINNIIVPPPSSVDKYVKVSSTDTTSDYLGDKLISDSTISRSVVASGANEKLRLAVAINQLISSNPGNLIGLGSDGKLRVINSQVVPDIVLSAGAGINITGSGPSTDPFIVSLQNPSVVPIRTCFNGAWQNLNVSSNNSNATYVAGTPQYRITFDGTIQFRGSATFTVNFGDYSTSARKRVANIITLPTTCVSLSELTGVTDLKSINYIDAPQTSADQIVQQYGYIIRKTNNVIQLEFQSSFSATTQKTIVVNFEGAVIYPNV
jgi:hypothetical protein